MNFNIDMLIVTTQEKIFLFIKELLEKELSHQILLHFHWSQNSLDAIDYYQLHFPSICFIDTSLPLVDPEEILKKIKENDKELFKMSKAIIVLSSLDPDSLLKTNKSILLGATDFYIKNIDDNDLYTLKNFEHKYIEILSKEIINSTQSFIKNNPSLSKINIFHDDEQRNLERIRHDETNSTNNMTNNGISAEIFHNKNLIQSRLSKKPIKAIMIAISTGGPQTFRKFLSQLKRLKYPLLVVQHMPEAFLTGYVQSLSSISQNISVKEATDREILVPNTIYFAPSHFHIKIEERDFSIHLRLDNTDGLIKGFIPSAEIMFESALKNRISILGIIMTGIGNDGVDNLTLLHQELRVPTIAQSPLDSTIFGMPKALILKNAADAVLLVEDIADVINNL